MICSLKTAAFDGIEAKRVEVQVSLGAGMPGFVIVGLPDKAINESKERVRAVLTVAGGGVSARAYYGEPQAGGFIERRRTFRFADSDGADGRDGTG